MSARKRTRSLSQSSPAAPTVPAERSDDAMQATPAAAASTPSLEGAAMAVGGAPALTVYTTNVIAPDAVGVRCIAVNHEQDRLVLARENGSMQLFHLDMHQNTPHFIELRRSGGRYHRTIQRIAFTADDQTLVVAYASGQMAVLCALTLLPMSVLERSGGTVYDLCSSGNFFFTAVADGTWRMLFYETKTRTLQQVQSAPKVTGSDRALCVAVSEALGVAVGGDDAGNVTLWVVPQLLAEFKQKNMDHGPLLFADIERTPHQERWTTRIPKGFPLALAVLSAPSIVGSSNPAAPTNSRRHSGGSDCYTPCVAVGSSIGDVILLAVDSGAQMKRFSQHKGPVSTLAVANGMFYASGWHESLRSYRCSAADGEWHPSEVKRRTHYHEASQVVVLDRHQLLLSASKDGTIMHSPVATLFSAAAHYLDASGQCFAFAKEREVLLQTRNNRIEGFRMSATKSFWSPVFSLTVQQDKFGLVGIWCDDALNVIISATDTRIHVMGVEWGTGVLPHKLECLESREVIGVIDCVFDAASGSAYVLGALELLQIRVKANAPSAQQREAAGFEVLLVSTALKQVFHRVTIVDGTLFLAGVQGCVAYPLMADGFVDSSEPPRVVSSRPTHSVGGGKALMDGTGYTSLTSSGGDVPLSIPHDAAFLHCVLGDEDAAITRKKSRKDNAPLCSVATFSKGLMLVDSKTWSMVHRLHMVRGFTMQDGSVLALDRNVEAAVEALPLCWKVRRFGN